MFYKAMSCQKWQKKTPPQKKKKKISEIWVISRHKIKMQTLEPQLQQLTQLSTPV